MIEELFYARNNGYLVTDVEKRQGNFIFYYAPSKKIVIYDVWYKKDVLQLAYNKRKNCNANIHPSIAQEVMDTIGKLAGIDTTGKTMQNLVDDGVVDEKASNMFNMNKDIKNIGV